MATDLPGDRVIVDGDDGPIAPWQNLDSLAPSFFSALHLGPQMFPVSFTRQLAQASEMFGNGGMDFPPIYIRSFV